MKIPPNKKASNRHFWAVQPTTATPKQVWEKWMEVATWKDWDTGLKEAQLEGDLKLGAKGYIITLQNQKIPFEVTQFEEGKQFTYVVPLPLGGLVVDHYFVEGETTRFVHEVWLEGFSSPLFALILGRQFRKMLPEVLVLLQQLVERNNKG